MKIYLDNCCLNRPFDDQLQDKVRLETDAILAIINMCEINKWEFCKSDVLIYEINQIIDYDRKQKVMRIYKYGKTEIKINKSIQLRANQLLEYNIKPFDALHLASAENGKVDIFLTTDKKLILASYSANMKIKVMNPVIWYLEEINNE